jgi:polar amino acid transport system substrate-binding protein
VAPPQLTLVTEESFPSVMMERGQMAGYAIDKIREAMRRAGITYRIDIEPWMRAYTVAQRVPNTCVFPTGRIPEREKLFTWVAPIAHTDWWLYGLAHRDYQVRTLEDARKLRIGGYVGDVRGEYLRGRGFQVDFAGTDSANLKKLMVGRIDLWVTSERFAQLRLREAGLEDEIAPVLLFNSIDLYLACHPGTAPALVARLAAAFSSIDRDGTSRAMEHKYDNR